MRAARGLRFPRGCWSLTSGATSGSRILPGERASGECWRCGGRGGGAALAAGSSGAVGRGRAHLSTRPPRGAGAERPLHGSWRGGLARTPGLTRDASGESGARAGSRGSAPAPRQTSLLPPRGEDGAPARPVPGSEGERGTLSQSRLLDDKTRSRVRVLVTGRDKGAPRRGCSVPRVRLRLKGALSFGALCHRRGSTATG